MFRNENLGGWGLRDGSRLVWVDGDASWLMDRVSRLAWLIWLIWLTWLAGEAS